MRDIKLLDRRVKIIYLSYTILEILWCGLFMVSLLSGIFDNHLFTLIMVFIVVLIPIAKRDNFGAEVE